jgi:hypothetical protein
VAAVARKLIASLELILELPGVELSSKLLPAAAGLARLPADGTPFPGGARVYLPELHSAERSVASALARLAAAPPRPASARGPKDLQAWLDAASAQLQVTLSDDQRAAVAAAAQERVLILTGGPGTGKTFVVTLAVRLWMQQGLRVRRACTRAGLRVLRAVCACVLTARGACGAAGCARPRAARRSAWPRCAHTRMRFLSSLPALFLLLPTHSRTRLARNAQLMADMAASAPELASVPPPSTIHRLLEFVPRDVSTPLGPYALSFTCSCVHAFMADVAAC